LGFRDQRPSECVTNADAIIVQALVASRALIGSVVYAKGFAIRQVLKGTEHSPMRGDGNAKRRPGDLSDRVLILFMASEWRQRYQRAQSERIRHTSRVTSIYEARRLVASFRQAILSKVFLNAFWNAFSKSFTSSEAPTCCAIATKRSWRAASVSLGLANDLRVMLRNPARERARSSHKRPVGRPRDCPLQKHDARAENLAYPHYNECRK
jgi:hypothetical protein